MAMTVINFATKFFVENSNDENRDAIAQVGLQGAIKIPDSLYRFFYFISLTHPNKYVHLETFSHQ